MTLLTAAQAVALEVGLQNSPTSIYASTDATAIQLLTILNRVGKEIAQRYDWAVLTKETSFTTLAAGVQTTLPADFDHIVNDTLYNRTSGDKIYGPYLAAQWQRSNAFVSAGCYYAYRIRGKSLMLEPNPTAGQSVYYEYLSTYWVDTDADGLGDAAAFTADANTTAFDENLLILGAIARLKEVKGLPYAEAFRRFETHMDLQFGRDGGKPKIRLDGGRFSVLGDGNTPESGFG